MTSDTSPNGRVDDLGLPLPAGVQFRSGKPKPYLVRIGRGDPGTAFAKYEEAIVHADEIRGLRARGIKVAPQPRAKTRTLEDAIDELLARKRVSGRRGPLTPCGIEDWERKMVFWRGQKFARQPLDRLDVATVEDAILARAREHPTAAREELQKAALRYAAGRGSEFQLGLLEIEPVRVSRQPKGRALGLAELDYLLSFAVDHQRRPLELLGNVGLRVSELTGLLPCHIDLDGAALRLPASLCKERRAKTIPLLDDEVALLREQLAWRPAGAERVFPRKGGSPWRREHFYTAVVVATRRRAAVAWRREHGLPADAATPFEWPAVVKGKATVPGIAPHDFRRTAATLMRDAGLTRDQAATRLGHADAGELLDRVYDRGDRVQRVRVALDGLGSLRDALTPTEAGRGVRASEHAVSASRPSRGRHLRAVS